MFQRKKVGKFAKEKIGKFGKRKSGWSLFFLNQTDNESGGCLFINKQRYL